MARLILFDIDLTLVTTHGAGRAAMTETFRQLFRIEDPTAGIRFDGRTDYAIFTEVIAVNGLDGKGDGVYERVVEGYLARLPASLRAKGGGPLPGVGALLDALAAEGAPVGLATGNMRRGAQAKLGHFGLWERFAAGGFGDETPDRAEVVRSAIVNLAAAAGHDPDPAACVVIGDTPLDVAAAHAAGARAMAVATGSYTVEALRESGAQYVLDDLTDTARVLEMLLG